MTGFKNFILRGNLVELAVAFIMAASFALVVTAFVAWLTSLMPDAADDVFSNATYFGAFLNAVISFVLLAAVVYFFVVTPYTKAKERFFPAEPEGTPADVALLTEIRDLLQAQGNRPL
jgi:large conductance mechanosensitive channel